MAPMQPPCHIRGMRSALACVLIVALGVGVAGADDSKALARHLRSRTHDRAIRTDVLEWHHTMSNGCVAYASTALRHIGVAIPEREQLDGDGVSRLTRGFVRFLEDRLGWTRVVDGAALRPGDLAFTTDVACCPGYPAHVFVFLGWRDRGKQIARIADNTGYGKARPLAAGGDRDGFAFALRAPTVSAASRDRATAP